MKRQRRIITDSQTAFRHFQQLEPDDLICCRLRIRPGEEHLLLDLAERGITGFPSFRSQLCSRSKALQTRLFSWAMIPGSTVIYTIHDLIETIKAYGRTGTGRVVLKLEGKNGGLGVLLFSSIEEIYNQAVPGLIAYPFVVQPFLDGARDIRVIIIDDYQEAYVRTNACGFRQNLHCGATAAPCTLTDKQLELCRQIMTRGGFPYAHLDLLHIDAATTYFSEINLRGGLRGASITSDDYRQRINAVHRRFIDGAQLSNKQ